MTLIVEDGTGLSNAESYISVSDATAYHAARGNSAWESIASDTIREQYLRKATQYLDSMYSARWRGSAINSTMSLDWPRAWVERDDYNGFVSGGQYYSYYDSDSVPQGIKDACCEAALAVISADLLAEQGQSVVREKVDVLEVQYSEFSSQRRRFPFIDSILRPFLVSGNKGVRV